MNELEKRSFYSFLGLYIFSSLLFIGVIGYWYYTAQKNALENETYYRLEHLADHISGEIIVSHMQGKEHTHAPPPKGIVLALIDTQGKVVEGKLLGRVPLKTGYYKLKNGYDVLVSDAPREHLDIKYVVVQTNTLEQEIASLRSMVFMVMMLVAFLIILIAWFLSKLFMRPVRQRVQQVERFINDITHELNTPISSLSMATEQALKHGECTPKTLKNISISTKQLYDIYRSLTYLNFSDKEEPDEIIDLHKILQQSIDYYRPLAEVKQIGFKVDLDATKCSLPHAQATLLFGNLIGNAIKYSPRGSEVEISLKERRLTVKDHGIGIDPQKQKEVFEKFIRGTSYSGGFGVGLSIVKSICEHYGIEISLHSVPGEGTEFTLRFPLKKAQYKENR
jgi:two-component system OmpR family sensor kinase